MYLFHSTFKLNKFFNSKKKIVFIIDNYKPVQSSLSRLKQSKLKKLSYDIHMTKTYLLVCWVSNYVTVARGKFISTHDNFYKKNRFCYNIWKIHFL